MWRWVGQFGLSIALALAPPVVGAQIYSPANTPTSAMANEFFVGKDYGKPLVKVNLINGVQKPGVYHVPEGTHLAEVIAYAGGAVEKADLSEITVVRTHGEKRSSLDINLESQLAKASSLAPVVDQDIVHIQVDRATDRTLTWVGILSGLASIALSIAVIDNQNRR